MIRNHNSSDYQLVNYILHSESASNFYFLHCQSTHQFCFNNKYNSLVCISRKPVSYGCLMPTTLVEWKLIVTNNDKRILP
jgi:hypothetical protein